ncbi:MAG TPA: CopD family protein [Baekduia sp.]
MTRRALRAVLVGATLLLALALPGSAFAHAQLETTSPQRDDLVASAPKVVSFTFDEAVSGTEGAIRVFDSKGDRVDDGNSYHPAGRGPTFAVGLKSGLAKGTYTATYRVVSADTHIVTGGFVFSIGARSAGAGSTVGQLLAGQKTGKVTSTGFVVARAAQYGAIGIAGGLLVFLLAVWLPVLTASGGGTTEWERAAERFVARLRIGLLVAALVGLVSALVGLGLQGAESAGVPLWKITGPVMSSVLSTRFGTIWLGGAIAWLVLGAATLLVLAPRGARAPVLRTASLGADGAVLGSRAAGPRLAPLLIPALALITLPALAGHASVQHPVWLFLPANLVHVSAMTVWLGGLTALLLCLPAATRALQNGADRTRLLAGVLARFSPIALGCVLVLMATGVIQALCQINAFSELWDTAYGRAVLVKIGLLLVLIALGAVNRRRTVPGLSAVARDGGTPGALGLLLRRTLRTEVAVIAVVLTVTGALAGYAPAKTVATGPVELTSTLGPAQLSLDVDPATVGSNLMHIYLLDPKSGAQYTKTKELTVTATLPSKGIGPLTLTTQPTGPGHYTIPAAVLGAPGTWTLDLTARVSDFDEYDRKVQVKIR